MEDDPCVLQLHEQFEQLVLNVEHCLRQGQWDGTRYKIVREAHRMACMLANSWTELIVDELPEALVLPFDELLHGLPTADWPGTTGTVKLTGGSVELLDQAALLGVSVRAGSLQCLPQLYGQLFFGDWRKIRKR